MRRIAIATLLLLAACSSTPTTPADPTLATVEQGQLKGVSSGDVVAFKGVPFAAPPVGNLRWRAPQPAAKWSGVRDASAYGHVCMQKYPSTDNGIGRETPSEDCLTLNIWTPQAAKGARLPVMFWIHGGGFVNGSGTAELYDGTSLAKRGVVIVTINYRMGRFGSFAHPLLNAEGGMVANYGMMDMIAALRWTKANIASFGGDPNNVTAFGESAGGIAVNRLMVSPGARGLFHKAIVESGAGREVPLYLNKANEQGQPSATSKGEAFIKSLGVNPATVADLRAIPADKILAAGDPSVAEAGPVIEGSTFPMSVADAFSKHFEAKIPYMVGSNSVEWPATQASLKQTLAGMFPLTDAQQADLAKNYPDADTFAANIIGDAVFTEPARYLAAQHSVTGQKTWLYRFSVLSTSVRGRMAGTRHAQERQYVFDTLKTSPYQTDENDKVQAQYVGAYWTQFARTGDPNGAGRPAWPMYLGVNDKLLEFTNDGPVAKSPPYPERWKALGALAAAR